jgi:hypothetical protein
MNIYGLDNLLRPLQFTRIQGLLEKAGSDDFSHGVLLQLYNNLDAAANWKRLQIATNPSKALQVLKVCTPEVVSYLTFLDAIHLFQVCRCTRLWQRNGILSVVFRFMKRYFSNPGKMRNTMRDMGAIISGSSVLWLIDSQSNFWDPGDLDIYVPRGMVQPMVHFLTHEEGYEVVPPPEGEVHGGPYIRLGHLESVTKLVKEDCKIDLMESHSQSSVHPVTTFHSTVVMNYITADSISVMYPKLTFSRIAVRGNCDQRSRSWEAKYLLRKFHLFSPPGVYTNFQHILCQQLARRTGDQFCLYINFGDTDDRVGRYRLSADWYFKTHSIFDPHHHCTPSMCTVAHYHRNPPDEVAIEVIARATLNQ